MMTSSKRFSDTKKLSLLPQIKIYGRLPPYYMHFQFNMQKNPHKMLFGNSYVKEVNGIGARTYRKAVCMALL